MSLRRRTLLTAGLGMGLAGAELLGLGLWGCRREPALPKLSHVPDFALTSQRGAPFGSRELTGKVWACAFMFTRCPTICPRITRRMRALQQRAESSDTKIELVSISVDPEHDTPEVLREYAQRFQADLRNWTFLTGEFQAIQRTAVDGFKMALDGRADPNAENYGIVHGSHLVLVDKTRDIRGYYRTEDEAEGERLLDHARNLSG